MTPPIILKIIVISQSIVRVKYTNKNIYVYKKRISQIISHALQSN